MPFSFGSNTMIGYMPRYRRSSIAGPLGGFQGALHCHTIASDGRKSVDELIAIYAALGYSFICITDHSVAGNHGGMRRSACAKSGRDILVMDGIEVCARARTGAIIHTVAVNVSNITAGLVVGLRRFVADMESRGAIVFAAHPHWTNNTPDDIAGQGLHGVEIYNHGCHRETGKSSGLVHWDQALARGEDMLGFAVDDTHGRPDLPDWDGGWVRVFCKRLDKRSIIGALKRGEFYSSTGPEIYDIRMEKETLTVRCSPVTIARLVGCNGYHRVKVAEPPTPMPEDPSRKAVTITFRLPAPDDIKSRYRYLRFECEDERTGKRAWTNTLFAPARSAQHKKAARAHHH